jgi:LPXTG-motif cell wall-anchored protein
VLIAAGLIAVTVVILAPPAHAQAAPTLTIQKVAIGASTTATFQVTGPTGTATLTADAVDGGPPAVAGPPLTSLLPGASYLVEEIEPQEGLSLFDTTFECTTLDGTVVQSGQGHQVIVQLTEDITCTFTNTVTRAGILGLKVVTGDTSTWTRPAQFHITCPELQLDIDIEPAVGPGGPGTYTIGQGSIPPATCTISETDTGSDAPVIVSSFVTNHGTLIAAGGNAVTFTSAAGDDLVVQFSNQFPPIGSGVPTQPRERPEQGTGGTTTTTTIAGGSTTTTTTTTATTTTVPGGGTTTTVLGGATTTSSGGGQAPTSTPTTAPQELPTTGDSAGTLIAAALGIMVVGLTLMARTRRFLD